LAEQLAVQSGRLSHPSTASAAWASAAGRKDHLVRKILPDTMFTNPEQSRLTMLRSWVLDHEVSEIEMTERQFWNFAQLQPVAEKPWTTFMGRVLYVPDMPIEAQKQLGIFDKRNPGAI
jgi:hypothetical protein